MTGSVSRTVRAGLTGAAILGAFWIGAAAAKPVTYELPEDTATLRPGSGVEVAEAHCLSCHSPDYIAMQPAKKGHAFWTAEVTKMIKAYGAPIEDQDAKTIADYLASTY